MKYIMFSGRNEEEKRVSPGECVTWGGKKKEKKKMKCTGNGFGKTKSFCRGRRQMEGIYFLKLVVGRKQQDTESKKKEEQNKEFNFWGRGFLAAHALFALLSHQISKRKGRGFCPSKKHTHTRECIWKEEFMSR